MKNKDATVQVLLKKNGRPIGLGTGMVVEKNGRVVTAYHVISSRKIQMQDLLKPPIYSIFVCDVIKGERDCKEAKLMAKDKQHDIALLSVNRKFSSVVKFVDDHELKDGDDVYVWGNISLLAPISSVFGKYANRLKQPYSNPDNFIASLPLLLFDFSTVHGLSGSPVFNTSGKCVGMVDALTLRASGSIFGIAIPSSTIMEFLKNNAPAK
ncbi:MAG: serine protease [Patescibacteria group bacterium]